MRLPIDEIHVGKRLRPVMASAVDGIAESFAAEGQVQPIVVVKNRAGLPGWSETQPKWRLAAGAHRLEAARRSGWSEIAAVEHQIDDAPEVAAEQLVRIEAQENLSRLALSAVDAALHVYAAINADHRLAAMFRLKERTERVTDLRQQEREFRAQRLAADKAGDKRKASHMASKAKRANSNLASARRDEKKARDHLTVITDPSWSPHDSIRQRRVPKTRSAALTPDVARGIRLLERVDQSLLAQLGNDPTLRTYRKELLELDRLVRVLGVDTLNSLRHSYLDSLRELKALCELQKIDPSVGRKCIDAAALGMQACSAVGALKTLRGMDKAQLQQREWDKISGSPVEQYRHAAKLLGRVVSAARKAQKEIKHCTNIRQDFPELEDVIVRFERLADRARNGA